MNTAIDRIKGYCCEVTQEQWDELVRVADEVGVKVGCASRSVRVDNNAFARLAVGSAILGVYPDKHAEHKPIPFHDFLAKLKGEEQWQPKAGEMVEVSGDDGHLYSAEYIGPSKGRHVVWTGGWDGAIVTDFPNCRPLRPTITRTEAEALLNKRIID
jgi:hypothetical protein